MSCQSKSPKWLPAHKNLRKTFRMSLEAREQPVGAKVFIHETLHRKAEKTWQMIISLTTLIQVLPVSSGNPAEMSKLVSMGTLWRAVVRAEKMFVHQCLSEEFWGHLNSSITERHQIVSKIKFTSLKQIYQLMYIKRFALWKPYTVWLMWADNFNKYKNCCPNIVLA